MKKKIDDIIMCYRNIESFKEVNKILEIYKKSKHFNPKKMIVILNPEEELKKYRNELEEYKEKYPEEYTIAKLIYEHKS